MLSWPDGGPPPRSSPPDHGPSLPAEVEAALAARDATQRPDRYLDPVSLDSLIVSIASLAWTIYNDRRMHSPEPPPPESIARQVRITLREHDTALPAAPAPSPRSSPPRSPATESLWPSQAQGPEPGARHRRPPAPASGRDAQSTQTAAPAGHARPAIRKARRRTLTSPVPWACADATRRRAGRGPAGRSPPCRDQAGMFRVAEPPPRIIDVALLEDGPRYGSARGACLRSLTYDGVTKIASDLPAITATVSQIAQSAGPSRTRQSSTKT